MIDGIAQRTVDYFINSGLIKEDKRRLYLYSLTNTLQSSICIAATLFIGLCMGMFFQNLVFFLAFKMLRKFSGGLHAGKYIYCLLFSLSANVVFMLAVKYLQTFDSSVFILIIEIAAVLLVTIFSPLESKNKKISGKEALVYKLLSLLICFILGGISLLLYFNGNNYYVPLGMAMLFNGILLTVGRAVFYFQNKSQAKASGNRI